jgi:hypothetical protein
MFSVLYALFLTRLHLSYYIIYFCFLSWLGRLVVCTSDLPDLLQDLDSEGLHVSQLSLDVVEVQVRFLGVDR